MEHSTAPIRLRDHHALAAAARDATSAFLGRFEVCGVGVTHYADEPCVSFLLRRDSPQTRSALDRWAADRRVAIRITVAANGLV